MIKGHRQRAHLLRPNPRCHNQKRIHQCKQQRKCIPQFHTQGAAQRNQPNSEKRHCPCGKSLILWTLAQHKPRNKRHNYHIRCHQKCLLRGRCVAQRNNLQRLCQKEQSAQNHSCLDILFRTALYCAAKQKSHPDRRSQKPHRHNPKGRERLCRHIPCDKAHPPEGRRQQKRKIRQQHFFLLAHLFASF